MGAVLRRRQSQFDVYSDGAQAPLHLIAGGRHVIDEKNP
jgi:hypothetical protein